MARRNAKNKRFNPVKTDRIRAEIKLLIEKVNTIQKITFDPEVYRLYDRNKFLHWEEQLYDHLLMGYMVMRGRFDSELYVTVDKISAKFILEEGHYRDTIRRGSEFAEILLIMREHDGVMKRYKLKEELLSFGKDWRQSSKLIKELIQMKALKPTNGDLVLSGELRGKKVKKS